MIGIHLPPSLHISMSGLQPGAHDPLQPSSPHSLPPHFGVHFTPQPPLGPAPQT
jgi:hypothetical protein